MKTNMFLCLHLSLPPCFIYIELLKLNFLNPPLVIATWIGILDEINGIWSNGFDRGDLSYKLHYDKIRDYCFLANTIREVKIGKGYEMISL